MSGLIYLDHAATTPTRPEVWEAMTPYAGDAFGNSSGVHGVSRRAKNALEEARERAAASIGADPMEIVFTSGGTESDNLALQGSVFADTGRRAVVIGATEHPAVLETARFLHRMGSDVAEVEVDGEGRVQPEVVVAALTENTSVVSVMLINNETGTINDVAGIAAAVRENQPQTLVHTDAIQAFASEKIDVDGLGVDLLSISGHKFGGPKGVGLLYVREGTKLEPVIHGGGQELGRRSGTHNVAGAVGLAAAMEVAVGDRDRFVSETSALRDRLAAAITEGLPDTVTNTPAWGRSPHHLNVRFPGVRNETLLVRLDAAGVAASAGSACQSGAPAVSHVLEAMGLPAVAVRESVRLSLGWTNTDREIEEAAAIMIDLVEGLR